jgi:glutamate synthase (NADPH/NADH) small chain
MTEIEGTKRLIPCELALIAVGFTQPENALLKSLGATQSKPGTVEAKEYKTSVESIFAAGDV